MFPRAEDNLAAKGAIRFWHKYTSATLFTHGHMGEAKCMLTLVGIPTLRAPEWMSLDADQPVYSMEWRIRYARRVTSSSLCAASSQSDPWVPPDRTGMADSLRQFRA